MTHDEAFDVVFRALGGGRFESIAQAAFRVLRQNYLPAYVQDVARRVLAASGKSPATQYEVLHECADRIVKHIPETLTT